jgi:methylated-DNA-[protein]-cysteine S-methyltransferase
MPVWTVCSPAPDTTLAIAADERALRYISFGAEPADPAWSRDDGSPVLREAVRQLELYFAGRLREFDLPLQMEGTPFQRRVWNALLKIPYGETITYAQLAARVDSPRGFRAVGAANGQNPLPIVVPCHRVINTGGGLGGFSCGLAYKRRLLDLEGQRSFEAMSASNSSSS